MEEIGAPVEREIERALVPRIVREDPETLVPVHLAHAFLDRCAHNVGLADFGYVAGRNATVDGLGVFGRSLRRSLTLHDALGKLKTKFALYSSAERIWWVHSGQKVAIHHRHTCETGAGRQFAQQCALLLLRDLVRLAAGPHWQPDEVLSLDPARDIRSMQTAFDGAQVTQSDSAGFVFPEHYLSLPMRWFRGLDTNIGHEPFEPSTPAGDFAGSIKQVTSALMAHGRCQLADIAAAVGMQPRTLQRRLAETEQEFSELLAEARFEAALKLMSDPNNKVIDIAFALGYADPANFARAFRTWTGRGPSEFRLSLSRKDV
jgi:AraC-like DNA-binding protein